MLTHEPNPQALAALAPPDPTVLKDAAVGDRYVVMDLMGPGEALSVVQVVDALMVEVELGDVSGVIQRVWLSADSGASHLGRWYALRRATHPVDELAVLASVGAHPPGVAPVPTRIVGTAFFPGGSGLWRPRPERVLPPFPVGGVLVIGHDFGTVTQYEDALRSGSEPVERNRTWRGLTATLERAGLSFSDCFFTNAYLGLRTGPAPTGAFPGRSDAAFRAASLAVLLRTILMQQPRLIITLGAFVPALLATLSPAALAGWLPARSLREIDEAEPLQYDVPFGEALRTTVVALTHPSLGRANAHRRRYVEHELLARANAVRST